MKSKTRHFLGLLALTLGLSLQPSALLLAAPLGTAFTYQGRLTDGGQPVNGSYDLKFTLYDAAGGSTLVGGPLTNAATGVSNGLFTVTLDFGTSAFDGTARWLQIGVRPVGLGLFTDLAPRQALTPTPYAVKALEAAGVAAGSITSAMLADGAVTAPKIVAGAVSQLGTPDGADPTALQVSDGGLVGLGTNLPSAGLHITTGRDIYQPNVRFQVVDGTGSYTNLLNAEEVAVSGDLLVVSAPFDNALTLVDVSNPAAPVLLNQIKNGSGVFTNLAQPRGLAFSGRLLAVAADAANAVTLIDLTDPLNPVRRSVLRDGDGVFNELGGAFQVAINGNLLAVAAHGDSAVTLADISNPASPVLRVVLKDGQFGFNDLQGASGVALSGNLLAVAASQDSAVTLVDVSNPASPVLRAVLKDGVGGFDSLGGANQVLLIGKLLAVAAAGDSALTLVDVSNPASPVLRAVLKDSVGGFDALAGAYGMACSGNLLALTAANDDAITLVDISDPSKPALKGVFRNYQGGLTVVRSPMGVAFAGATLAVACFAPGGLALVQPVATQAALATQGAVGIGTTTPAAPLHVVGNVIVEGADTVDIGALRVALGNNAAAGGEYSTALGPYSTASGDYSTALGASAVASGLYSTALGYSTTASGEDSMAIGSDSIASGTNAIVLGSGCAATQTHAMALGRNARANHVGSFVWGDSYFGNVTSSATNQFTVRASGGVRFFSNSGLSAGVSLTNGATAWSTLSDREAKKDFTPLDTREVLEKLAALPIQRWHYKWEDAGFTPHIGPMAQDFKAAFYPGRDDKTISTLEFDGVALAAIQGLHQKLEEAVRAKDTRIQALEKDVAALKAMVNSLLKN